MQRSNFKFLALSVGLLLAGSASASQVTSDLNAARSLQQESPSAVTDIFDGQSLKRSLRPGVIVDALCAGERRFEPQGSFCKIEAFADTLSRNPSIHPRGFALSFNSDDINLPFREVAGDSREILAALQAVERHLLLVQATEATQQRQPSSVSSGPYSINVDGAEAQSLARLLKSAHAGLASMCTFDCDADCTRDCSAADLSYRNKLGATVQRAVNPGNTVYAADIYSGNGQNYSIQTLRVVNTGKIKPILDLLLRWNADICQEGTVCELNIGCDFVGGARCSIVPTP